MLLTIEKNAFVTRLSSQWIETSAIDVGPAGRVRRRDAYHSETIANNVRLSTVRGGRNNREIIRSLAAVRMEPHDILAVLDFGGE